MEIGYTLKKIREEKNISQQKVADYLDIPQRTYSNMESGKSKISCQHLYKLSSYFGFDLVEKLQTQCFILRQGKLPIQKKDIKTKDYYEKLIANYEKSIKQRDEMISSLIDRLKYLEKKHC
ncbi:helix-turn-helix domain-containing protein [Tenacibaculum sp. FZY0031]|uniref:helix-turn-helix domain-containing protein n=1 Tax=unclassified Tenacibaculum TaxID=2635139 RepID=UPI002E9FC290|nr:helix-turn-helix domain-containing protein [Tenacibaculum sp. FZY0031]